jgi:ubiquinone biosynthesis protein
MAEWAETHTSFGRDYQLLSLMDEFAHTIHGEVDYRAEGRNMDIFRANFLDEPALTVPRVYWQYTTTRVLTMQRVSGIKISDIAALDRAGINRRHVAENSVRLMLRQAFEFGFFHADPHPGNFFVRPDAGLALLDYGMVGHLSKRLQDLLLEMGVALVSSDAERLTDDLYALGVASDPVKRPALGREVEHMLARFSTSSMKELAAADMFNELLNIAFRYRLRLPSEIVMLLRVIVLSEGLGVALDPNFQLLPFASPYLKHFFQKRRAPDVMAGRMVQGALDAADVGLQLPRQITRLLTQIERGDTQVNINPDSLQDIMRQMQRMVNRIALSIILAGTIMGLGLILVAYQPPMWEQLGGWITIITFLASLIFGAVLMWSIFRTGGD